MESKRKMNFRSRLKEFVRRPAVLLASLFILAVLGFWFVNRLVNRFGEQKKALARHLFQQSQTEIRNGEYDSAIDDLRAALDYNPNNFDYELSLARVLRDTGKNDPSKRGEAESYLVSLWEHDPQNSLVNLAIARLYAGENLIEKTLQYYHNAIYGVWPADAQTQRSDTQLELIRFLLRMNADPQAQAELISWSSSLPPDTSLRLTIADLFAQAKDYEHALTEYQQVLRSGQNDAMPMAGAGNSAFQLERYRTAQHYLNDLASKTELTAEARLELETANAILEINPYAQHISNREMIHRSVRAFNQAGTRLADCIQQKNNLPEAEQKKTGSAQTPNAATSDPPPAPSSASADPLKDLNQKWSALKPRMIATTTSDVRDSAMDITFEIEQQTASECGAPTGLDEALYLLSQNPTGAER
jgi:tetratricopeptide (TPR) repeat protein